MKHCILCLVLLVSSFSPSFAAREKIESLAADPYVSALVINAANNEVLVEENADALIYPASVLKLMDLLVILDLVEKGVLELDEMVQITDEAYKMGGSQVYLDPKEQFSVEELLYALMVQSANDAAVALAIHVAGSKEGFVALMNEKAKALGMNNTRFHTVHGLPPSKGQEVDVTTAKDLALLCMALINKPATFEYTSTKVRDFRGGAFVMRTHNHLLESVFGCDGLKTGYFSAAGFSIAATAQRKGVRILALVLGSKDRKVRDAKASEFLNKGFTLVPPSLEATSVSPVTAEKKVDAKVEEAPVDVSAVANETDAPVPEVEEKSGWGKKLFWAGGVVVLALFIFVRLRSRKPKNAKYLRRR